MSTQLSPVSEGQTVVQRIIGQFREQLIRGALKPGDPLPSEPQLAEQLQVGRTSVREAMKTLAAFGVVTIRRGEGTRISAPGSEATWDALSFSMILSGSASWELFELRRIVELGYCDLVVERADEVQIARLAAMVAEFKKLIEDGCSAADLRRHDLRFHDLLLEMTKNQPLIRVGKTVMALFAASMEKALDTPAVRRAALKDHSDMLTAIKKGDKAKFREVIGRSHETWKEFI